MEAKDITWYLIDAKEKILGKVAVKVADFVRGKNTPHFDPHLDPKVGIVVINADQVKVTGSKESDKIYYNHSGYPGGIKAESFGSLIKRRPDQPILRAVKGMLPKNRLGRRFLTRVRVFAGDQHSHDAQQPKKIEL